jgi:hypothetical protein
MDSDLPDEREETNDVMCVVVRKDGSIDQVPDGKINKGDRIPQAGDSYVLGGIRCTVRGHAYTPLLKHTWVLFLVEN